MIQSIIFGIFYGLELPPIPDPLDVELKIAELAPPPLSQDSLKLELQFGNPIDVMMIGSGAIAGNFLAGEFSFQKGKDYADYSESRVGFDFSRIFGPVLGDLGLSYGCNARLQRWDGLDFDLVSIFPSRWGGLWFNSDLGWAQFLSHNLIYIGAQTDLQFSSKLGDWRSEVILSRQGLSGQKIDRLYLIFSNEWSDGLKFTELSGGYEPFLNLPCLRARLGMGRAPFFSWLDVNHNWPCLVRFDTLYQSATQLEPAPRLDEPYSSLGVNLNLKLGPTQARIFRQEMKSFIYWEDLDQDSLIEPANRDVDQAGIEFKILLKLPYLSHGMSLVYQEIVPELPLQPQFLLHNSLNINHQKWSLQIDQYYSSTRYLNDHKLRGYLLFSSKLSYQSNQWEIFAQVENLFDATYERIPYHPEEGRRYSIGGSLTHYTHSDIAH